jgi:NitT/TauT family transport system substrate-binding protein
MALLALAVVSLVVASTATAAPARPARAEGTTISVGIQATFGLTPILLALRHGWLKSGGITDVKYNVFSTPAAMLAAAAQGQITVGLQTIPPAWGYNKIASGTKLKFVAPAAWNVVAFGAKDGSPFPTATKSNWKTAVEAWKGKKIGVPALNGIVDLYAKYMIKAAGIEATTVAVGAGPSGVAALQNGVVDVIGADQQTVAQLQAQHIGHAVLNTGIGQGPPELVDTFTSGFLASESEIAKNRALYTAFSTGLAKARAWMRSPKHKNDVLDILTRKVGLDTGQAAILYKIGIPSLASVKLNPAVWNKTISAFSAAGVLTAPTPSYADLVSDIAR